MIKLILKFLFVSVIYISLDIILSRFYAPIVNYDEEFPTYFEGLQQVPTLISEVFKLIILALIMSYFLREFFRIIKTEISFLKSLLFYSSFIISMKLVFGLVNFMRFYAMFNDPFYELLYAGLGFNIFDLFQIILSFAIIKFNLLDLLNFKTKTLGIISSALIILSLFLPWLTLEGSAGTNFSGIQTQKITFLGYLFSFGKIGGVLSIIGIIGFIKKYKYLWVVGVFILLDTLWSIYVFSNSNAEFSTSIEGITSSVSSKYEIQYGIYLFVISVILFVYLSLVNIKWKK